MKSGAVVSGASSYVMGAGASVRIFESKNLDLIEIAIHDRISQTHAAAWLSRIELRDLSKAIAAILFPLEREEHPRPEVRRIRPEAGVGGAG